jgi:hypothetical protein
VVEDRQVELAEPLRVGEDVDCDDLPAPDRDGPDRERLSVAGFDGTTSRTAPIASWRSSGSSAGYATTVSALLCTPG